ncbi:MAG TPA: Ig-like domain-containing protein [Thermoanaerobaculia bacterium]|nr:Ig-like domain-containing protein [Thermoanaerobaculia bacterium]
MRSLSARLLLSLFIIVLPSVALAHDVTISGTTTFQALDGSSSDHDGVVNGVFTVSDGNLVVAGTVNCNDDSTESACSMAFSASGDIVVSGALYAENRRGGGTGGAIGLNAGRDLLVSSGAVISTAAKSAAGSTGGSITATVSRNVSLASGSTIDSGSSNARGGTINIAAAGSVSVDGNVLSGPSRTVLATRLTGAALDGGTANQIGGEIRISSATFVEPALVVGSNANIVSQGDNNGAGPVILEGCGITIKGLVAALSRKESTSKVSIRSGKDILVDARDLGVTGATLGRLGRIRADAPSGTAVNHALELFATETVDVLGPAAASSSLFPLTALAGVNDSRSVGGLIRLVSTGDAVNASGNVIHDGRSAAGATGGPVEISAKGDVSLATAVIRSFGDSSTNNPARGGGSITVRSYSGNVIWTNGIGDVRPTGSASGLPPIDQGTITITACGTVNTTGSSFPVNGSPTGIFPAVTTGACSPAAPSLPAGVVLVTCNTPPVANDVAASTNEDTSLTVTLSGSDADGDALTFSIVSGPSNGSLGAITQVDSTSATVVYTPNDDFNGIDAFVYQANDGNGGTDDATVTIAIAAVNDPPAFLAGPTAISLEDAGPQSYANWATSISAGPADEAGQSVTFSVTNDDPSLFSVQPALAADGTLTWTSAADAYGSATLTIVAQDDGGTANGGNDTSAPQNGTISITPVNDAPSFTAGGNVTVDEDSGSYSATWASGISAGPNEDGQTVAFQLTNDNASLFSAAPSISPSGVLTFTLAPDANGVANVTVVLTDDGGTANGGVDTSAPQSFLITVNAINDPPSFTKGPDQSVLEDSGAHTIAGWATNVSAGPADEAGQSVTFIVSATNPSLFTVQPAVSSNGDLTFTGAPDAFGTSTVTVTAQDDGGGSNTSAPQSFTITIVGVNDAPSFVPGGDATVDEDAGPQSIAWATSISAGPNEAGQTLTFVTANSNTALFTAQPAISASGVLTFTTAPNAFGSATVSVYLTDDGGTANGGVDTSATVTFTIAVNPVNDPPVAGADAYDTIGNTLLQVAASQTVASPAVFVAGSVLSNDSDVDAPPGSLTASLVAGSVTAGAVVTMNADGTFTYLPPAGYAGATDSFSYQVSDGSASATGVVTITLKGRVWYVRNNGVAPGTGRSTEPFVLLNAASFVRPVEVSGSSQRQHSAGARSETGMAVERGGVMTQSASSPNDTIYIFAGDGTTQFQDSGFKLQSGQRLLGEGVALTVPVSVNGGANPTVLLPAGTKPKITNIGGSGVTATGVSGVTVAGLEITGATGDGMTLTNASSVTVDTVAIKSNLGSGISGTTVSGFVLIGSTVESNGNAAGEAGIDFADVTGTVNLTNSTVTGSAEDNVAIRNTTGSATITVSGCTISSNSATGNDGLQVHISGTATATVSATNNTFTANRGDHFQAIGVGTGNLSVTFKSNTLSGGHASALGQGVSLNAGGAFSGTFSYDVDGNVFNGAKTNAISAVLGFSATSAVMSGHIRNNSIGTAGVASSCSSQGSGISVESFDDGTHTVSIAGNQVRRCFDRGIQVIAQDGNGSVNLTATGNVVAEMVGASAREGFYLNAGATSLNINGVSDGHFVCASIGGVGALANNFDGNNAGGFTDIRLRQRFNTTIRLPGYSGAFNDAAAVQAYVSGNNSGNSTLANIASNGFVGGAACTLP